MSALGIVETLLVLALLAVGVLTLACVALVAERRHQLHSIELLGERSAHWRTAWTEERNERRVENQDHRDRAAKIESENDLLREKLARVNAQYAALLDDVRRRAFLDLAKPGALQLPVVGEIDPMGMVLRAETIESLKRTDRATVHLYDGAPPVNPGDAPSGKYLGSTEIIIDPRVGSPEEFRFKNGSSLVLHDDGDGEPLKGTSE